MQLRKFWGGKCKTIIEINFRCKPIIYWHFHTNKFIAQALLYEKISTGFIKVQKNNAYTMVETEGFMKKLEEIVFIIALLYMILRLTELRVTARWEYS